MTNRTSEPSPLVEEIIRRAVDIHGPGDSPSVVGEIIDRHPELSRGEIADDFSAAADWMRSGPYAGEP
jgi:hypothetical protein